MKYFRTPTYEMVFGMTRAICGEHEHYIEALDGVDIEGGIEITQAEFEAAAKSREPAPEDEAELQESPANSTDTAGLAAVH